MVISETLIFGKRKFWDWSIIFAIIVLGGFFGYFLGQKIGKIYPTLFEKIPAQIGKPITEEKITEILQETQEIPKIEEKKYIEKAEKGEGITHLARRALKKYLQENPQNFKVTPEHKVYIEDYLAKKLGYGWLKLGESLEFSQDLIKEALEKSQNLTPEQLQNLTQYSQLVPFSNY